MLEPGMKVPDFTLHDANGNAVSLHAVSYTHLTLPTIYSV